MAGSDIDLYFDFASPYAWFITGPLDALAAEHGRRVRWHPLMLWAVRKQFRLQPPMEGEARRSYLLRDAARSARFFGLEYREPPKLVVSTHLAARAYYWIEDRDGTLARRFGNAVFAAFFTQARDIGEPGVIGDIAGGLGIDRDELLTATKSPGLKQRLRDRVEEAARRGVWGSPFVFIDGEPFFGADRLPQIRRWLEEGGF